MNRFTQKTEQQEYVLLETELTQRDMEYTGEAITRLGQMEDLYEQLIKERKFLAQELEKLRLADKSKTVTFKQYMAMKMTNANMLDLLHQSGFKENKK